MDYSPTRLLHPWNFSRQESWSGLPFPSPGDLPNPGIKPPFPALQVDDLQSEPLGKLKTDPREGIYYMCLVIQLCVTLCNHGPSFTRLLCPWGLFRPENWSGYPCPPPGHLPNTGIKPRPPALQADSLPSEPAGKPKNTGMGSLFLLQGIFPTQGSNPGLPHCRQVLHLLSHKGNPIILEWIAYPFSSGSSRPRNRTGVSCIADGFLTNWAMREAHRVTWLMAKALRPDCLVQIHFPLACSVTIGSYWPSP